MGLLNILFVAFLFILAFGIKMEKTSRLRTQGQTMMPFHTRPLVRKLTPLEQGFVLALPNIMAKEHVMHVNGGKKGNKGTRARVVPECFRIMCVDMVNRHFPGLLKYPSDGLFGLVPEWSGQAIWLMDYDDVLYKETFMHQDCGADADARGCYAAVIAWGECEGGGARDLR